MIKDAIVQVRVSQTLKEEFERVVKAQLREAVVNDEEYEHISTAEILRSFIKAYVGGKIQ